MKNITIIFIIAAFALGIVAGVVGTGMSSKLPQNCAVLGQLYLEMVKKQYGIDDFASDKWNHVVNRETKLVNLCYEKLEFETSKGGENE